MKKLIVIFLSMVLLSLSFKDLIIHAHFYLNRSFIAKSFCVNLNNPELSCHGKCYLKKSIKENQEQENKLPNPTEEKNINNLFISVYVNLFISNTREDYKNKATFINSTFYSFTYLKEIFRPPQFA